MTYEDMIFMDSAGAIQVWHDILKTNRGLSQLPNLCPCWTQPNLAVLRRLGRAYGVLRYCASCGATVITEFSDDTGP